MSIKIAKQNDKELYVGDIDEDNEVEITIISDHGFDKSIWLSMNDCKQLMHHMIDITLTDSLRRENKKLYRHTSK